MPGKESGSALPAGYQLGEYKIQSVLGIGGFGITYKAEDTALDSIVAIKEYFPQGFSSRSQDQTQTIRPKADGYDNYKWGLQEFVKEAQALAKFKHNNIVRVLRFMEANGTAYMIMEYEEGEAMGDRLKRTGGFLKEADLLKIFLPVLSGLQAVHDAGLLHLDIKPDNIYIRTDGTPMLIDFGSVRVTKKENADQRVALTPAYSALEQYPSINREPGPWSDVYGMGATIYTCIIGKPPADVMKRYETLKRKYPDPLEPATNFERPLYAKHIRETLVHALELDPKKRPQSAIAMQKALMGQSLEEAEKVTRPTAAFNSGFIGIRKAVVEEEKKKGRGFFEKLFLILVIVPAITVFTVQILIQTNILSRSEVYGRLESAFTQSSQVASDAQQELKRTLRLDEGQSIYQQTPILSTAQINERKKKLPPFPLTRSLAYTLTGHSSHVVQMAFFPNGDILASISADGTLILWNVQTGKQVKTISDTSDSFGAFAISSDGTKLAKTIKGNAIQVIDLVNNSIVFTLSGHTDFVNQIAFSPDGKNIVSVSDDKTMILWDSEKGVLINRNEDFTDSVLTADFSPGSSLLVTGDGSGMLQHWSNPSTRRLVNIQANSVNEEITSVVFSPNGKWIATGGSKSFVKLWNTGLDEADKDIKDSHRNIYAIGFSPDSKWVLTAGSGEKVNIWDIESAQTTHYIQTSESSIYSLAISPDGQWVATAGESRNINLWKAAQAAKP